MSLQFPCALWHRKTVCMPFWPEYRTARVAHACDFNPELSLLPAFELRGWEVVFSNNTLVIAHENGFQTTIQNITPNRVVVHVIDSAIRISMGRRADVEFRIDDESVLNWIVRFLFYWGFDVRGTHIERGVVVPELF